MEKKQLKYIFNYIENCNMCDSKAKYHKIIGKRLNTSQGKNPRKKIGITTTICKCNICGLVYSNPQPMPTNIQYHYGIPPEKYWDENYFKIKSGSFSVEIERVKKLINFREGAKSLDIGAGLGHQMIAYAENGFDTYGIEPSLPFYERAISKMNVSPDKIKLAQIENANYPTNYFDFISFGAVLEHLYNPSEAIKKALIWLKPNGIILIKVPSSNWQINKFANLYYKLILTDYVGNISPMHEPFHLYEFSLKSFELHAQKNNYDIEFYEYSVCDTFMPKIFDFILKPYMKWTKTGMELYLWFRKK